VCFLALLPKNLESQLRELLGGPLRKGELVGIDVLLVCLPRGASLVGGGREAARGGVEFVLALHEVHYDEGVSDVYQVVVLQLQRLVQLHKCALALSEVLYEIRVFFDRVFDLEMASSEAEASLLVLGFD